LAGYSPELLSHFQRYLNFLKVSLISTVAVLRTALCINSICDETTS
jgi:hypothetical protein